MKEIHIDHNVTCHKYTFNHEPETLDTEKINISEIIKNNDVVIFMKGSVDFPQCGFSAVAMTILQKFNLKIKTINVLENDIIRTAIKEYSQHPTIPQIFIKGAFIGGASELKKMYETNVLQEIFIKNNLIN